MTEWHAGDSNYKNENDKLVASFETQKSTSSVQTMGAFSFFGV